MARDLGIALPEIVGNEKVVKKIELRRYLSDSIGEHTLNDIMSELQKPGRDPRESFEKLEFRQDIKTLKDLKQGMVLEGIVTNVAAFGAFVDIGVHQDGLIHISELTDRYIKDPAEVVHVGKRLKVEVLLVEPERKRISLTARIGQSRKTKNVPEAPAQKEKKGFKSNPFANL